MSNLHLNKMAPGCACRYLESYRAKFNSAVRRDNLVTDSLKEISSKQKDLKKKLKVRPLSPSTDRVEFI
jgi:hypothetical protein